MGRNNRAFLCDDDSEKYLFDYVRRGFKWGKSIYTHQGEGLDVGNSQAFPNGGERGGRVQGDRRKIFVSGHSAGGYLTNMVGLDKKWLTKYRIDADAIAALIPFSGHAISHFAYRQAKGMKDTQPSIDEFAPLFYVRPDAPPLIIVSGDREMEMLGRYEENAYFWRMMKVAGHKNTYIYELDGYDHGSMAAPAFHILKNHVRMILKGSETR